jgi:hypothetical protein
MKFLKSSMGTAVTAVLIAVEIWPLDSRNAARCARAGLFARFAAVVQAAASRAIRSRL